MSGFLIYSRPTVQLRFHLDGWMSDTVMVYYNNIDSGLDVDLQLMSAGLSLQSLLAGWTSSQVAVIRCPFSATY
jgi:hypothetical protein